MKLYKKSNLILLILLFQVTISSYAQHYINIDDLIRICTHNKREYAYDLQNLLKTGGYTTSKLYANNNTFYDSSNNYVHTTILDNINNGFKLEYVIVNPTEKVIKIYMDYIKNNYINVGLNDGISSKYIKDGKFLISAYTSKNKHFTIQILNNSSGTYFVPAVEIKDSKESIITSFSSSASLYIQAGKQYTLRASGTIFLGFLAGKTGPTGINGYEFYNVVQNFKHGSLLGKVGKNGNWFLIGNQTTITSKKSGLLYVKVNDLDPSNNNGSFILDYK